MGGISVGLVPPQPLKVELGGEAFRCTLLVSNQEYMYCRFYYYSTFKFVPVRIPVSECS